MFTPATKDQLKIRMAICGPSGSGKTYTGLAMLTHFAPKKRAVICSEHGSARKYADLFQFDVMELKSFAVEKYIEGVNEAGRLGYEGILVDGISHAWAGKDGLLEFVDQVAQRDKSKNSFGAWRSATPKQNELIECLLGCPMHLIVTMRTKTEYVVERNEQTGKTAPRKIGTQAVQRDGVEYEFDVVGEIDQSHIMSITKSRCHTIADAVIAKPGKELAETLLKWANSGAPVQVAANNDDSF